MLSFNEENLFKNYKEIVRTCILQGYALPCLIKEYNIPKEYCLTNKEKQILFNQMENIVREKLYDMLQYRKETENDILNGKSHLENIQMFHEHEVHLFLKEYPNFKEIITEF